MSTTVQAPVEHEVNIVDVFLVQIKLVANVLKHE